MRFTESEFLRKIKELSFEDKEKEQLKNVVLALVIYAYKSYKSSLVVLKSGYYTNGLISCRTIIECVFVFNHLISEPEKVYDYVYKKNKWTDESIKSMAFLSANSSLYQKYRELSNYSHANYNAVLDNLNTKGQLSIYPNEYKLDDGLALNNAVYHYLINKVSEHYKLSLDELKNVDKTKKFVEYRDDFAKHNFSMFRFD